MTNERVKGKQLGSSAWHDRGVKDFDPVLGATEDDDLAAKIARRDPLNRLSHLPGTIDLIQSFLFIQVAVKNGIDDLT